MTSTTTHSEGANITRQLRLLSDSIRQLASLEDPQSLLQQAVQKLHTDFGYEHVTLFLTHEGALTLHAAAGLFTALTPAGMRWTGGRGIIGHVAESHQLYVSNNVKNDPHFVKLKGAAIASQLAAPLKLGSELLGVLNVESQTANAFGELDINTIEALANLITVSLRSSRLIKQLRQRDAISEAARRAAISVTSSLDVDVVLETLCRETMQVFSADGVSLWIVHEDSELRLKVTLGVGDKFLGELHTLKLDDPLSIAVRAVRDQKVYRVNHLQTSPQGLPATKAQALLSVPIVHERVSLGAITVIDAQIADRFDEGDEAAAMALAAQFAIAIINARLYQQSQWRLHHLATLGEITNAALAGASLLDTMRALAERLGDLIGADNCFVTLWDERHQRTIPMAASGQLSDLYPKVEVDAGERTITESVLLAGHSLVIDDVFNSPYVSERIARLFPSRSMLALPLMVGNRKLGAALIAFNQPHQFSPDEIAVAEQASKQIALAVVQATLLDQERRQNARLALLNEVGQQISATLDVQEVFQTVVEAMTSRFGYAEAGISVPDGDELVLVASSETEEMGVPAGFRQKLGFGIIGQVAQTKAIYVTSSIREDPIYFNPIGRNYGSALGLPLLREDRLLGVLYIESSETHAFDESDVQALQTLANQIAITVDNLRLYQGARSRLRELSAIQSIARVVASTLSLDDVFQSIVRVLHETFDYSYVLIAMLEGDYLRSKAYIGYERADLIHDLPIDKGVGGRTVRTGLTQFVSDTSADADFVPTAPNIASQICVPLIDSGNHSVLGVLNVESDDRRRLTEDDVNILATFAGQVTVAITNARLFEAEKTQRRYAEALRDATRTLNSTLDIGQVLDRLLEELSKLVEFDSTAVMLIDDGYFKVVAGRGFANLDEILKLRIPVSDDPLFAEVQTTMAPMVISDARNDPRFKGWGNTGYVRSWIGVPLIFKQQVRGSLTVDHSQPARYGAAEAEVVFGIARQAAIAIENARLYEDVMRRAEMLAALHAISLDISASRDLSTLLQIIVERAVKLLGGHSGGLYLTDPERRQVRCVVSYNTGRDFTGVVLDYGEGVAGTVAETREPIIIDDHRQWSARAEIFSRIEEVVGIVSAPMLWKDRVLGVLHVVHNREERKFNQADLELLTLFAGQAAIAVENARLLAETQQHAAEQRALFRAAADFGAGLAAEGVLQAVAHHMVIVLRSPCCTVLRWERASNRLVTLIDYDTQSGHGVADLPGTTYDLARYPATQQVLDSRQPRIIVADHNDAPTSPEQEELVAYEYGSMLMIPIMTGGEQPAVFGLAELYRNEGDDLFSNHDITLGQNLAAQAAVALENAQLHTAVQERARELDSLLTASASLLSTLELEPLLQNILTAARAAILAAEKGAILLVDSITGKLQMRAVSGYEDPRVNTFGFVTDSGYSAKSLRLRQPLLIEDARREADVRYDGDLPEVLEIRSAIVAPLLSADSLTPSLGVISLDSTRPYAFTHTDLRLLTAFANTAAVAIYHARLHSEVKTLAITDALTGLPNRRAFDRTFNLEVARAVRYNYPLSLIICDIDSFKQYNDTFGHPAGDERLKEVARLLHANVRDPDLAARYGGEEFAIILPHTTKEGAVALAQRICDSAAQFAPQTPELGEHMPGYTISFGVATCPQDATNAIDLLRAADNAELAAKRAGKNRVVAA